MAFTFMTEVAPGDDPVRLDICIWLNLLNSTSTACEGLLCQIRKGHVSVIGVRVDIRSHAMDESSLHCFHSPDEPSDTAIPSALKGSLRSYTFTPLLLLLQ